MEEIFTSRDAILLEEILFAVLTVARGDEEILLHFQKCFCVSRDEFLAARGNLSDNNEGARFSVAVRSVKIKNAQNLNEVGLGVKCVVGVGGTEHPTSEGSPGTEWNLDRQFEIGDIWKDKIEIGVWQEQEKEGKAPWLRSLDQFGKRIRSKLKGPNLAYLSSSGLVEENSPNSNVITNNNNNIPSMNNNNALLPSDLAEEPHASPATPRLSKFSFSLIDSDRPHKSKSKDRRRDTIHIPDSNWVRSLFSTLGKTTPKKEPIEADNGKEERYLDMKSPIPTGQQDLGGEKDPNWRAKSERSFFSKWDPNGRGQLGLKRNGKNAGQVESPTNIEQGNIKAKSEVSVRRQLFRDCSDSSSLIPENGMSIDNKVITNLSPVPDTKSNPEVNSVSEQRTETEFSTISLTDDSSINTDRNLKIDDTKSCTTSSKWSYPMKYGSLKLSGRNEFKLWKTMSLSLRDKDSLSGEDDRKMSRFSEDNPLFASSPFRDPNKRIVPILQEEIESDTIKIKVKIGSASVKLKDCFVKMNCSKWTMEEEAIIDLSANRKERGLRRPPTVALTFQLRSQAPSTLISPFKVFVLSLRQFFSIEKNLEVNEEKDFGLCLPLSPNSKLILKSLAFVYDIPEAQVSLACWLVLMQGHASASPILNKYTTATTTDQSEESRENANIVVEDQPKTLKKIPGACGNIHPKYLFHWLTKIEAAASCSSYNEEQERQIGSSIQVFIDHFCQQLKRIHAAFPINQSSYLAFGLRCVHLLAESESLQGIMGRANLQVGNFWPKSNILNAVQIHAKNWTEDLIKEIQIGKSRAPSSSQIPQTYTQEVNGSSGAQTPMSPSSSVTRSQSSFLLQAIMNGEKAMLSVNDFIVLGEKVYETNFKSEIDESYLHIVWPTIASVLVTLLGPIQSILQSSGSKTILSTETDSIQDLHISLWVLLLQLSKLQRFESSREKDDSSMLLPETFSETFFLLSRLWLNICLFKAKEMMTLECQTDDLLPSAYDDGLSSSARELIEFIAVIQEKISRFFFPPEKKFKENLALFLEDGIKDVVEMYQFQICNLALEKVSQNNTIVLEMGIAANNIDRVTAEAEGLVSSFSPLREKKVEDIFPLRASTRDACVFFISKSLPRLPAWITNSLSSGEKDHLLDWIKTAVDPILDCTPKSAVLLRHFWDFVFHLVQEKSKCLTDPKDFRFLGNFMESLNFVYKISLCVELHGESQIEYRNFMETVELKGSSTPEVIQAYFEERHKEQELSCLGKSPLVVNAYFCKDRGLKVVVHMSPYVHLRQDKKLPLTNDANDKNNQLSRRLPSNSLGKNIRLAAQMKLRASGVIESFSKSSSVSFYVKASVVPSNWFKKVRGKKTKATSKNPPVFGDEFSFNIKKSEKGVVNGGFLLLRLKQSTLTTSRVESEALIPLKDIPILSVEERRSNKHLHLGLSSPSSLQDYKTLLELANRKHDREATSFVAQLHQSYWTV